MIIDYKENLTLGEYHPQRYENWWDYNENTRRKFLMLAFLPYIANTDNDRHHPNYKAFVLAIEEMAIYVNNYLRDDFEEAYIMLEKLKVMKTMWWPCGTSPYYLIPDMIRICEITIEENEPHDEFPDTNHY